MFTIPKFTRRSLFAKVVGVIGFMRWQAAPAGPPVSVIKGFANLTSPDIRGLLCSTQPMKASSGIQWCVITEPRYFISFDRTKPATRRADVVAALKAR